MSRLLRSPHVTTIIPASGPTVGGTKVLILGRDFSTCIICSPAVPPEVTFGGVRATSVQLVSGETLIAYTPAHVAGDVDVTVTQFDGTATAPQKFTYLDAGDLEFVLLPIYTAPVRGAFGSEFHTVATIGILGDKSVTVYGIDNGCLLTTPHAEADGPFTYPPGDFPLPADCQVLWPARFLAVAKDQISSVTFNDRVFDVTRSASSNGTEVPVVRSSKFTTRPIALLNVPISTHFRNTLRIYAASPTTAVVSFLNQHVTVTLGAGPTTFDPAYAAFGSFPIPTDPTAQATMRVTVQSSGGTPIWAFITTTNNDTQQITTITPDF